jgi:hypothetical protein
MLAPVRSQMSTLTATVANGLTRARPGTVPSLDFPGPGSGCLNRTGRSGWDVASGPAPA